MFVTTILEPVPIGSCLVFLSSVTISRSSDTTVYPRRLELFQFAAH